MPRQPTLFCHSECSQKAPLAGALLWNDRFRGCREGSCESFNRGRFDCRMRSADTLGCQVMRVSPRNNRRSPLASVLDDPEAAGVDCSSEVACSRGPGRRARSLDHGVGSCWRRTGRRSGESLFAVCAAMGSAEITHRTARFNSESSRLTFSARGHVPTCTAASRGGLGVLRVLKPASRAQVKNSLRWAWSRDLPIRQFVRMYSWISPETVQRVDDQAHA